MPDDYEPQNVTAWRLRELLQHEKDNQALRILTAELLAVLRDALSSLDAIGENWGGDHRGIAELVAETKARVKPILAKTEGR